MSTTAVTSRLYPHQATLVIVPEEVQPISTNRLYLRPMTVTDAAAIHEIRRRQDVADWLYPKITHKNISETEAMISKKNFATPDASGALRRSFFFAITLSDDPLQKVIGGAGINALFPAPSVGYSIHPDFWSNGYATEAVAGVIDAWWSLERKTFDEDMAELSPEKLFAACNKANIGSMKVLQKTGFALYHEFTVGDETVALLELERCAR
ncbi:Acyl-CoA N-acyltransferase [Penicillium soppii]|uniref:Acyl-CoA N-acyltransferase n=1 Tax=Penicillium soppii TaxID=69789 RepID=UPI0025484B97|nr:Acyl-CoA N-acyltransferase [Penicillium soppii]KAJ5871696.1 Acyl-CoA N-acyltransferase [Penicillium soppii]